MSARKAKSWRSWMKIRARNQIEGTTIKITRGVTNSHVHIDIAEHSRRFDRGRTWGDPWYPVWFAGTRAVPSHVPSTSRSNHRPSPVFWAPMSATISGGRKRLGLRQAMFDKFRRCASRVLPMLAVAEFQKLNLGLDKLVSYERLVQVAGCHKQ